MIFVHLERLPLKINITISSKKTKLFSLRIMVLCPKSVCKLIQLRKKKILFLHKIEADVQRCSVKKVFLKILQNSQENIRARIFILINTVLLKKRLWHRCFLVNFAKILRTAFFREYLRWLLLIKILITLSNVRKVASF